MSSGHESFSHESFGAAPVRATPRCRSLATIASHYDVLGVPADASPEAIRAAYRDRARRHHPDRRWVDDAMDDEAMAAVNEAYRVLSDNGRRAVYDRALGPGSIASAQVDPLVDPLVDPSSDEPELDQPPPERVRRSPLSPPGPARVPWKAMLIVAVIGSALILVASAFTDPPSEEPPDGILRAGSCVEIEPNNDVREVACTGDDDLVVKYLIPIDGRCPVGTLAHRDRLGLGTACLEG